MVDSKKSVDSTKVTNNKSVEIIKEKNGVAYRLNNSLFNYETAKRNIVKNVFYNKISIISLDEETKKTISNLKSLSSEELKELLEINLGFHLKEFVKQSRISKTKINIHYSKLVNIITNDYKDFKSNEDEILFKKTLQIQKRLDEIERICSEKTGQLKTIKNEINDKITDVAQRNILKIEERRNKPTEIQEFLERQQQDLDKKLKNSDLINEEISNISGNIDELIKEKENLIVELNSLKLITNDKIDKQFAKKEKSIAILEIEKIESYIWMRNCLILLKRIIRDVEIELGLRRVEGSWDKILGNFDEIKDQSSRVFNDFNFFDSIANVENKIDNARKINVNERVINTKSSEELFNK